MSTIGHSEPAKCKNSFVTFRTHTRRRVAVTLRRGARVFPRDSTVHSRTNDYTIGEGVGEEGIGFSNEFRK